MTVGVFCQLFALYLLRPTVMYAVIGLGIVLAYLVGGTNTAITDAASVVRQSRGIAEAGATVSVYAMLFATALATVKLR